MAHQAPASGIKMSTLRFPLRWGEMDALGHINNAQYLRYFEESRTAWGEAVGIHLDGKQEGMILLKATLTYQQQLSYPADIEVVLYAGAIGRTSFHMVNTLCVLGCDTPVALGEFVLVWFDYLGGKPMPVPVALRAVLEGRRSSL